MDGQNRPVRLPKGTALGLAIACLSEKNLKLLLLFRCSLVRTAAQRRSLAVGSVKVVGACEDSEGHRPMSGRAQDAVTVMDKGRAGGNGFNFSSAKWGVHIYAKYANT